MSASVEVGNSASLQMSEILNSKVERDHLELGTTGTAMFIYRLIHGHFHIGLVIIPRPPYCVEGQYGTRDDNQANMEMPMY